MGNSYITLITFRGEGGTKNSLNLSGFDFLGFGQTPANSETSIINKEESCFRDGARSENLGWQVVSNCRA